MVAEEVLGTDILSLEVFSGSLRMLKSFFKRFVESSCDHWGGHLINQCYVGFPFICYVWFLLVCVNVLVTKTKVYSSHYFRTNWPSNEVVSPPGVSVPHCDLQHSPRLFIQMEVKLFPPLWTQGLWHRLHTHAHTHIHMDYSNMLLIWRGKSFPN